MKNCELVAWNQLIYVCEHNAETEKEIVNKEKKQKINVKDVFALFLIEIINVGLFIINGCSLKTLGMLMTILKNFMMHTRSVKRQMANPTRKALSVCMCFFSN